MILEYEEAVKQAIGTQQEFALTLIIVVGVLLLVALIMTTIFSEKIGEEKEFPILVTLCATSILLLFSYFPLRSIALENVGLEGDESSYYASQLNEKYDIYVLPDMSTSQWQLFPQSWWKQEFYAISNETDEVKTYRLEEVKEGYMTLLDTKDGKALGIHQ